MANKFKDIPRKGKTMPKAPIAIKKTRKTRTPRASLTPRFTQRYEFDGYGNLGYLSVGYLRMLVNGIPRTVSDEYEIDLSENFAMVAPHTAVEELLTPKRGRKQAVAAGSVVEEDMDDSDEDEI